MVSRAEFMKYFPYIIEAIEANNEYLSIPGIVQHISKILEYNITKGKLNRGMLFYDTCEKLQRENESFESDPKLHFILGWCIEMAQGYFLIYDDIIDNSQTRRGQLCWYKYENIGLSAINDGLLLQQIIFKVLKYYFEHKPYYVHLLNTLNEITLKTSMGQFLDNYFTKNPNKMKNNTKEMSDAIMTYKTAYYSFVFPVFWAFHVNHIQNDEIFAKAEKVLLEIGRFFQTQDDYIDCFGDPEITGKIGTDIQEGKCTWLSATALNIMSSEQQKIMEESYGIDDPQHVAKIKKLYIELDIPNLYKKFENESYAKIMNMIRRIKEIPAEIFTTELNKLYKRQK